MNPYAIPPLAAALLNFGIVVWVLAQAPANRLRFKFMTWSFMQGLWNLGIGCAYLVPDAPTALFVYKVAVTSVVRFLAPAFLDFVVEFTEPERSRRDQWIVWISYGVCTVFLVLGLVLLDFMREVRHFYWGYYLKAETGEALFGIPFGVIVVYAISRLYRAIASSSGDRRNQLGYLLIGAIVGFGSGFTNFLPLYGVAMYPIGNLLNTLYSVLVAYAIIQYRLMDIELVLCRSTVYAMLCGSLTAVYLALVAVLQRVFGHYGLQESAVFHTAAFPITVLLAPAAKAHIEPFVQHRFFHQPSREARSLASRKDMALFEVWAAEMAHELSKPLTHIMNAGSQLEETVKGTSKAKVKTISKEVQRASEILDGFTMLAPQRKLHRLDIPIPTLMEEALEVTGVSEDKTIRIVREYDYTDPVPVNPGQIVQVLTNLIQNAAQAMPEGGTLTLAVGARPDLRHRTHVLIEIRDTGKGITPKVLAQVFEPFFTTREAQGGRGIGLTISRAMIERHGGRIRIESPLSALGGTRLSVMLPVQNPEEESHET